MANFKSYGATITVPDRYAEGHALTAKEAAAMNSLMAEFISHKVRSKIFGNLNKGDQASPELAVEAQTYADNASASFEFGAARAAGLGTPRTVDPIAKEARSIARVQVMAAIANAGYKGVSKKGGDVGEGEYPFEKFSEKVAAVALNEKVLAKAKKVVAARAGKADEEIEVDL